jgi:predicted dehydrogenase
MRIQGVQPLRSASRRAFLTTAAKTGAAGALFHIIPRSALGGPRFKAPSEKLNVAGIGLGAQGVGDVMGAAAENIVALCDVDEHYAAGAFQRWPGAKRYRDFRKMFDAQKDIDAVVVATPDHLHYAVSMAAIKLGKHVYCEKPLTHTITEARSLAEAARKAGVATQMGNQGNAGEGVRLIQEWLEDGAIGEVREVHCWTNKPEFPAGMGRPKETPPVPEGLDWDLWLGPAPWRPYHPAYLPRKWRNWWDFGSSSLGDMGCHVLNTPWRALNLGLPTSVEAHSQGLTDEAAPLSAVVYYDFPARGKLPPVRLTWYEGGMMPPRPLELEDDRRMGDNEGCLFVGERGKILCCCYGQSPRIIPESKMQAIGRPSRRIPRSPGHFQEWLNACKGGPKPGSHFEHAAVLTEVVQLGNLAIRAGHDIQQKHGGQNGHCLRLHWDKEHGKVSNVPVANRYLQTEYRKGWEV